MLASTPQSFKCSECGQNITPTHDSVGYGLRRSATLDAQFRVCYECCGKLDRKEMLESGKAVLYLSPNPEYAKQHKLCPGESFGTWKLTNWPGTLVILCGEPKRGRHNFAGTRYDVWFQIEGQQWHGVQYGENTQLCRCRRIKG